MASYNHQSILRSDVIKKLDDKIKDPTGKLPPSVLMQNALKNLPLIRIIEKPYRQALETLALEVVYEAYPALKELNANVVAKLVDKVSVTDEIEDVSDVENNDEELLNTLKNAAYKRRLVNNLMQGASVRGSNIYHLIKDHLDAIDEELVSRYNKVVESVYGLYDLVNDMTVQMTSNNVDAKGVYMKLESQAMGFVSTKIRDGKIYIKAQAVAFPFLIYEIIKGFFQILNIHAWDKSADTKDKKQKIISLIDTPGNEMLDLKYGRYIYDAINDIFLKYSSSNSHPKTREYFLVELYKMPDTKKFIEFIENSILGKLTPVQEQWAKNTLKRIESDLSRT